MGFLRVHHFWIMLFTACLLASNTATSYAQNCAVPNTFPTPLPWTSQFGDCRGNGCSRRHTGLDLFYPRNQAVNIPDGCEIVTNGDPHNGYVFNNKLQPTNNSAGQTVGSDTGGYGFQMFLRCEIGGGSPPITLRYSHLPENPFTAAKQIIQGHSGNADYDAPHYHFEILIGNRPVDPECVLFGEKEYNKNMHSSGGIRPEADSCYYCPPEITGSQADLCNPSVREALVNHSSLCTRDVTKSVPNCDGECTVNPSRVSGTGQPQTYTGEAGDPRTHPDHGPYDPVDPVTVTPGDLNTIYPPLEEDPPIEPPPPRVPGTPGGTADLTPPPTGDASDVPLTSCGTDTWTAMVNQAVMQTRREDIMNKRFITKADSVLQYSCFAQDIVAIADTGVYFSGSEVWAERDIPNPDATDHPTEGNNRDPETIKIYDKETRETTYGFNHEDRYFVNYLTRELLPESLTLSVDSAYRSYINGHFTHDAPTAGDPNSGPPLCKTMASIWQAAKCKNFDDPTVFYTFQDLTTMDPRDFPETMRCGGP